jgi:hypothetical protein
MATNLNIKLSFLCLSTVTLGSLLAGLISERFPSSRALQLRGGSLYGVTSSPRRLGCQWEQQTRFIKLLALKRIENTFIENLPEHMNIVTSVLCVGELELKLSRL